MSTVSDGLDFDEICDLFLRQGTLNPPAEIHGMLCGQLAAGVRLSAPAWLRKVGEFMEAGGELAGADAELAGRIYRRTLAELEDDSMTFQPLLPDDDTELAVRLEALAQWCNGFLVGFALVDRQGRQLPELVADAIRDLAAIAQVGATEDGDEADYIEVHEFVRLVALNVFLECGQQIEQGVAAPGPEVKAVTGNPVQGLFQRTLH